MAIGTKRIEDYLPIVKYNEGLYTELPVTIASDLIVTGTTTIAGVSLTDLTVTGNTTIGNAATDTLGVTGVTTFTAGATTDAVNVIGTAITTGKAIEVTDLAALTDGQGLLITSSATAMTSTGHLIYSNHTGATTVSGVLNQFSSASTDETIIVGITASAANTGSALAITTAAATGTGLTITANSLTSGKAISVTASSASTDAGTSFETALFSTTMTGIGGVGGRVRAYMTTNVALGDWSNALKGEVTYGANGRTTGLGSSILAEMTLSAGTTSGTYAPLEVELNLGSNSPIGARTSFAYLSANGTATNFIDSGYVLNLQGLGSATSGKIFQANTQTASHALKIIIGSTPYYMLLSATGA